MPKFALKAHALGDLEARDDAPLDLLAGCASSLARSPILCPGLTIPAIIQMANEVFQDYGIEHVRRSTTIRAIFGSCMTAKQAYR